MNPRVGSMALGLILMCSSPALSANTIGSDDIIDGEVKTSDLATSSVTTAKIANGNVINEDLGANAVTTDKIMNLTVGTADLANDSVTAAKLATGAVNSASILDGTIATEDLAAGAVTDDQIAGPISASKIDGSGLDADTLDGLDSTDLDSLYQRKYAKVAVVAVSGGLYGSPLEAMNNLASWCGTPTAENPCLIKILPGVYDLGGSNFITAPSHVDIEGSGRNVTKIVSHGSSWLSSTVWYNGDGPFELRDITIENLGPGAGCNDTRAFGVGGGYSPRLKDVTIRVSGAGMNVGVFVVNHINSKPVLDGVDVLASNPLECTGGTFGVMAETMVDVSVLNSKISATGASSAAFYFAANSTATVTNSQLFADGYAVWGDGISAPGFSTMSMYQSRVEGSGASLYATNGNVIRAANSQLVGPLPSPPGAVKLFSCFDGSFDPIP